MTDAKVARLSAAIDEDPFDPRAYAVLGDYLQELGDPRGELIARQLGARSVTNELAAAEIIATLGQPPGVQFHYANGYARSARIDPGTAKGTKDALAHPSGRFLVELHVLSSSRDNNAPLTGTINAISAALRPTLRVLHLGVRMTGALCHAEERELGDMSALWASLPRLEVLELLGNRASFGTIDAPRLRSFDWSTSILTADAAAALAKARVPALQHLTLSCATTTERPETTAMRALGTLLARDDLPALTHLSLQDVTNADKLIEILAASPLLRRLTRFELVRSDLTDTGALTIIANHGAFTHLEEFELHFNEVPTERIEQLQERFPQVNHTPSSDGEGDDDDDDHYDDVDE